jgi:hypothetical protein
MSSRSARRRGIANRPTRREPTGAFITVVIALALTGCVGTADTTSTTNGADVAYSAEYRAARAAATSDFENKVLADGNISSSEYDEAMNRFFECLESRSLDVTPKRTDAGLYTFDLTGSWDDAVVRSAMADCAVGTTEIIEPLYSTIVQNPLKRDVHDVTAECLVAVGFVQAPFTGDDFMREFDTAEFATAVMDDPKGSRCMQNPNYHNVGRTP